MYCEDYFIRVTNNPSRNDFVQCLSGTNPGLNQVTVPSIQISKTTECNSNSESKASLIKH